MFIPELCPLSETVYSSSFCPQPLAVGWLDIDFPHQVGTTTKDFQQSLQQLCDHPVNRMRGYHTCHFCEKHNADGAIRVIDKDGEMVAPQMVAHYVTEHDYLPPARFINAVMSTHGGWESSLASSVRQMADSPTETAQRMFYHSLINGRIGFRADDTALVRGESCITSAEIKGLQIPCRRATNADSMLIVMANIPWMQQAFPKHLYVEIEGYTALEIALSHNMGLIVQVNGPGQPCWAGVSPRDVPGFFSSGRGALKA